MRWPEGFMWGTAASSTQCEGAAPASDWRDFERAGHVPPSADGNGFATRHAEDFRLLAGLGLTHHRLSIEWARIEPEPGRRDPAAVERYREVLQTARDHGLVPWVCLHHFSLPRWFANQGGFLPEVNRTGRGGTASWARHVDFVAETYGDLVEGWQPVNEPNFYAHGAYRIGVLPPAHRDRDEAALATEAIHLATAEAAARLRQTGAPVASIYALSGTVAHDEAPATAALAERLHQADWVPGLGLFRDGVLRVARREAVERPDLAGCFDLIGFSYYSTLGIAEGRIVPHPPGAPRSPLGYGIWADGLGLVLDRLHAEVPGVPLLLAEYGIGTDDDHQRAAYLERGLEVVHDAIDRGIDVRGFFHWTAVDNYEWHHGYDVRFGIVDRDRRVRPSAEVLRREALGTGA
jgi:beta-glucosidase